MRFYNNRMLVIARARPGVVEAILEGHGGRNIGKLQGECSLAQDIGGILDDEVRGEFLLGRFQNQGIERVQGLPEAQILKLHLGQEDLLEL